METEMTLSAALALADDGFAVFPVAKSKTPRISNDLAEKHGWLVNGKGSFYLGTTDPARVREMWAAVEPRSGIGAWMEGSGLIAIDDDTAKKGVTSEFIERHRDELWSTLVQRTQGGGYHYIFEDEGKPLSSGPMSEAIDVKSRGGYIVMAPSAGYEIVNNVAPVPMSKTLRSAVLKEQASYKVTRDAKVGSTASDDVLIAGIIDGSDFHDATLTLINRWAGEGVKKAERLDKLMEIYNSSSHADPDHADHARWEKRHADIHRMNETAEAFRYIPFDEIMSAFAGAEVVTEPRISTGSSELDAIMAAFSGGDLPPVSPPPTSSAFLEIDGDELLKTDLPDISYIVPDYLIEGGLHSVAGPSGVGKTRYISLLLACLMTGRTDIMGMPAGRPVRAMYFANEERAEDVQRRIKATMHVNGLTGGKKPLIRGKDDGTLRLLSSEGGVVAKNERVIEWIVKQAKATETELIIFDPFNTLGGEEENSAVAVSEVMDAMRDITAETGAAIMFIHHTPKDRTDAPDALRGDSNAWRGSGAIYSALDMGFTLFPLLPDGLKKEERQRLRRASAAGLCGKYIVQDTGKVREGETLAPVAYQFVGQEVRPGGKPIGALKVIDADLACGEMNLALNMAAVETASLTAHEWAAPLISELGVGRTETTMSEIDRILTDAGAGDWTGKDKASATRGRGKKLLDLFATPQASTGHVVQIFYNPDGPRTAKVRVEIERQK